MSHYEEKCAQGKAILRGKANTPIQQAAVPLAEEIQTFFYSLHAEEKANISRLEEIHKQILDTDRKILEFMDQYEPSGEDEKYAVTWLLNFQAEIFANWSMKVGYLLDDLERDTDRFSLHVERMLAEPWEAYGKVQFAYQDVLRRGKKIIEEYYNILKLRQCHVSTPRYGAMRSPRDVRERMIKRIDELARLCLERVQNGTERMRELYFKFSDHRFAEEAARHAKVSSWASMAGVFTGAVTIAITLVGLILGILQWLSPNIIRTAPEHPLQIQSVSK